MNESNQNHEPTTIDDLHDRLVDRALAEVVGDETPPDFRRTHLGRHRCEANRRTAAPTNFARTALAR